MQKLNRFLTWPTLILLLLLCKVAEAQTSGAPPTPDSDAAGWAKLLYEAFTSKSWSVLIGLVLVGLVYPIRRFGPDLFKTQLGGVAIAFLLSLCGTLGGALAVHVAFSWALVASSLATAATAAGVWEWIKDRLPGAATAAAQASTTPASNQTSTAAQIGGPT